LINFNVVLLKDGIKEWLIILMNPYNMISAFARRSQRLSKC